MTASEETLLNIHELCVEYRTREGALKALRDVSLQIEAGETVGIAGESGSGKSTLALAIMRYLGANGEITNGEITFDGTDLATLSEQEIRSLRGNKIAHVPQDPKKSLNPSMRVGRQISETILTHQDLSRQEAQEKTVELLREVKMMDPEYNATRYPHELSGGMQQRVLLAMALSCNPQLMILDEPTTGLDVTTQVKILSLINDLKDEYQTSFLLITHNLGVISEIADRVKILYAGEVMETGSVEQVFERPANPYTAGLIKALPDPHKRREIEGIPGNVTDTYDIPQGCIFANRCEYATDECRESEIPLEGVDSDAGHFSRCIHWDRVKPPTADPSKVTPKVEPTDSVILSVDGLSKHYGVIDSFFERFITKDPPVKAVDGVSFDIHEGELLGLVGESGCGKSTLGKCLLGLLEPTAGSVNYEGTALEDLSAEGYQRFRSDVQAVFQNPDSSLNPKKTVANIINRPIELFRDFDQDERTEYVTSLITDVGLGPKYLMRRPHELSGGEKQRVAVARALAADPSLVILDEPVSALDVSVQANIINMLKTLQLEYDTSFLLISHDLSVVRHVSDRIAVMYLGKLVETGPTDEIFSAPHHPYTEALISNIPDIEPGFLESAINLEGEVPSARHPPSGCSFHTRCPKKIGEVCETTEPVLEDVQASDSGRHFISCHLDEAEMGSQ